MNSAAELPGADRCVRAGGRTQGIVVAVDERGIRRSTKTLRGRNGAPAGSGNQVRGRWRIELGLGFAEERKAQLVYGARADGPSVTGVDLLDVGDDPAAEVPELGARQLENRERIECVVVVVVVVDGELLVFVQNLIEARGKLVAAIGGFDHVLRQSARASRAWHEPHQAQRHRVEALLRNLVIRKNVGV